jgi:hypothetical protein
MSDFREREERMIADKIFRMSDAGIHEHQWTNVDPELFENGLRRCITCRTITEDPDYTPTTDEIRRACWDESSSPDVAYAQFDRWLAEHDRDMKEAGWDEGYQVGYRHGASGEWVYENPNPYTEIHGRSAATDAPPPA